MDEQLNRDANRDEQGSQGLQRSSSNMSGPGGSNTGSGEGAVDQAMTMARDVGEQARTIAADAGSRAQDLARRTRDQAMSAGDSLYQQGAKAGEYITRGVDEYPFTALLVAGAIGYGIAYLIHHRWS